MRVKPDSAMNLYDRTVFYDWGEDSPLIPSFDREVKAMVGLMDKICETLAKKGWKLHR